MIQSVPRKVNLPPKRQYTKEDIIETAFEIARTKGRANLSARTIAQSLHCSTSPIYTVFSTMQEIEDLVCERAVDVMLEYQTQERTESPLLDVCLGYVLFAVYEKQLFLDMFVHKVEYSEHNRELKRWAFRELLEKMLSRDSALADLTDNQRRELLSILWTYSHGMGALLCVGAMGDIDEDSIIANLRKLIDPLLKKSNL